MGCGSSKPRGGFECGRRRGLIPRLILQGDIIVSGQRAGDFFLVPGSAMVTLRRGSSLHNPNAKPRNGGEDQARRTF